jgi:hypothetical protein
VPKFETQFVIFSLNARYENGFEEETSRRRHARIDFKTLTPTHLKTKTLLLKVADIGGEDRTETKHGGLTLHNLDPQHL